MRKRHILGLGALLAILALNLIPTGEARSQRPPREGGTAAARIADRTKLKEEDVALVLRELGPDVRRELAAGRTVELPGLGVLRVVRVPEHRNLVDGRPAMIPASNYVEFVPTQELVGAANSPTAVPATVVEPFEYHPLPDRVPSTKLPNTKVPSTRER